MSVESLKRRFEERQAELDEERTTKEQRKKNLREYTAFLKLPVNAENDFFCDWCVMDFRAPSYKVWSEHYGIGMWQSFCPLCGRPVCRWITNKADDPYYNKSSRIRSMRSEFETDTLQPEQYGFRTLYGDPFEKYGNILDKQEEEIRARYLSMGLSGEIVNEKTEKETMMEYFET